MKNMVSLSFDIEEFDVPLENGIDIPFEEQMRISHYGALRILDVMKRYGLRATFFCTVRFAENAPDVVARIVNEGHEIASHGCCHSDFKIEHLAESKARLETVSGRTVYGYRMARMALLSEKEVANAGYEYNSSLNPTFIPGRYNKTNMPATKFIKDGVIQIPASVSPVFRLPLFWLGLHNYPMWLYKFLARWTLARRKALVIYMHPWEFYNIHEMDRKYSLSWIMTHNCGVALEKRLCSVIECLQNINAEFVTMHELAEMNW